MSVWQIGIVLYVPTDMSSQMEYGVDRDGDGFVAVEIIHAMAECNSHTIQLDDGERRYLATVFQDLMEDAGFSVGYPHKIMRDGTLPAWDSKPKIKSDDGWVCAYRGIFPSEVFPGSPAVYDFHDFIMPVVKK